jgi:hypothetical protein
MKYLLKSGLWFAILLVAAVIILPGCSSLKKNGAKTLPEAAPALPPTLEETIKAIGYKYKAYQGGSFFLMSFTTKAKDFPVILRWNGVNHDYVIIKLIVVDMVEEYKYSEDVLRRLNVLNARYDSVKFTINDETGDILASFFLDRSMLDPPRLRGAIAALVITSEKEYNSLANLVVESEITL